jgi:hypothetical protein
VITALSKSRRTECGAYGGFPSSILAMGWAAPLSVSVRKCCHGRCLGGGWYRRRSDSHSCDPLACNDVDRPCAGHHLSRPCPLLEGPGRPTGKSPKSCPALCRKIIPLTCRANQFYQLARLTREEGRIAIVTKRGMRCGGRDSAGAQGDRRADP